MTDKLLSLSEASKETPYSQEYLGLLIRKNRLKGTKQEGKWFITEKDLNEYLKKVATASYRRQETLNVKIPEAENKKVLTNLKWALVLATVIIVSLVVWGTSFKKSESEFTIEKDSKNNLIIHADNPDSIGSVTVVPK